MKAEEFDKLFDEGEDISHLLDLSSSRKPNLEQKRVNVDLPVWVVNQLDREAKRVGVTRQSIIKMWIAQRLDNNETIKAV
jgi:hypothetical protein